MTGCEYVVDATGCDPARLASRAPLEEIVQTVIADLALRPLGEPRWHQFGGPGGITSLVMLSESHLALHTFPERGYAAFNLYHCSAQPEWPWAERLRDALGAREVTVRKLRRGEVSQTAHRVPDLRL